ncbi:MAG: class I SAM-dependent methyltransferase [Promicromonosporaceae bacterium]|nr:class I SAM-dependent methyltransferase [Promicromonosporaceae bacterium]
MRKRPAPWSAYTTPDFWADEHISAGMLAAHLHPDWDAASRNHATIARAAAWLSGALGLTEGTRVLDLGCGPGLYAVRLARAGAAVTGLDVSPRSVAYARAAAEEGLCADFRVANYLTEELGGPYDAVLFSFEDVCVLSPTQRAGLLARLAGALVPGGVLALDVTSAARYDDVTEAITEVEEPAGGFWAPGAHTVTSETWKYPAERLVLERHIVTDADGVREYWNWMACLTPDEMKAELVTAGFLNVELLGDLTGAAYREQAPSFALLARR